MNVGMFIMENPAILIVLILITMIIAAMVPNHNKDNWRY